MAISHYRLPLETDAPGGLVLGARASLKEWCASEGETLAPANL